MAENGRKPDDDERRRLKKMASEGETTHFEDLPNKDNNKTDSQENTSENNSENTENNSFDNNEKSAQNPNTIVGEEFNPTAGATKSSDMDYTKYKTADGNVLEEVPEAFVEPVISFDDPKTTTTTGAGAKKPPINQDMAGQTAEEDERSAEAMFDGGVEIYKMLIGWGKDISKISDKKIRKLMVLDKINVMLPIQVQDGSGNAMMVTIKDFIDNYNESVENNFVYSQDFIDKIRLPAIREMKKRGIGLTDKDQILLWGLIEGARVVVMLGTFQYQKWSIIDDAKIDWAEKKAKGATAAVNNPQQQAPPPPPFQEPPISQSPTTPPEFQQQAKPTVSPTNVQNNQVITDVVVEADNELRESGEKETDN